MDTTPIDRRKRGIPCFSTFPIKNTILRQTINISGSFKEMLFAKDNGYRHYPLSKRDYILKKYYCTYSTYGENYHFTVSIHYKLYNKK